MMVKDTAGNEFNAASNGLVTAIFTYNEKNYEINKELLAISKSSLELNNSVDILMALNKIIELLNSINDKLGRD